jgi:hypothetical protein
MSAHWYATAPPDANWLVVGGTRRGKSGLLQLVSRAAIRDGRTGLTCVDPHGEYARAVAEWAANPANVAGRKIHVLDCASDRAFGLNPLQRADDSWESCHDAATVLAAVVESRFDAPPEALPRLSRIIYIAAMLCARHDLTLLEMVELLSLGAGELRRSLLQDFDNRIVRRELEDLHTLAEKKPERFLELVESTKNRFVRWLGDRRLARILGQKKGLDPRAVMDGRELVALDLSALSYSDAAFIGCLVTSMFFAAARRRPPMRSARHRLVLDEAESLITTDVARMTDQCAKYGLNITAAIQRLGQVRAKGEFIADALAVNCAVKVCFGGLEPGSARYMSELFFTGSLDLAEWKPGSDRPVAVGQDKQTVRSSSRAEHEAEHEAESRTSSHSYGEAVGTFEGMSVSSGDFSGAGDSSSMVMTPPAVLFGPNAPNATVIPVPLSQSAGESASNGSSTQSGASSGSSHISTDSHGEATTTGRGTSRGRSVTAGESEVFVTRYEWLPTTMYSLEEQLHRLTGELMNLPRRECFVKVEDARPFRTRTADLTPAFKSMAFKRVLLPRALKTWALASPYLVPAADVDADIAARLNGIAAPEKPMPDFSVPEPMPVLDHPDQFAADFWAKRRLPRLNDQPPKPKPKKARRRLPGTAEMPGRERFRVVDGDKKE